MSVQLANYLNTVVEALADWPIPEDREMADRVMIDIGKAMDGEPRWSLDEMRGFIEALVPPLVRQQIDTGIANGTLDASRACAQNRQC